MLEALTFDDVLLIPHYSEVLPSDVSLATSLSTALSLAIPVLSAAMDAVTEEEMAIAMAKEGGLGIIHKNMEIHRQASLVRYVKSHASMVGAAVGVGKAGIERAEALVEAGTDVLVVDTAHGHSQRVLETARELSTYPVTLVVGNIVSKEAACDLAEVGVHAVKVGIGPGSICTTRIVSGVGCPQLTAIMQVAGALKDSSVRVIADGGIRYSGDIVKALAAGAHCVMLGSMLAGTNEAPGEIVYIEDQPYKVYRGMGSLGAMRQGSADRYCQEKGAQKLVPEGVEGLVAYKGAISDVLYQILGGIRSGMGYLGAADLQMLKSHARFVRVTHSGKTESHVHNLHHIQQSPNYR